MANERQIPAKAVARRSPRRLHDIEASKGACPLPTVVSAHKASDPQTSLSTPLGAAAREGSERRRDRSRRRDQLRLRSSDHPREPVWPKQGRSRRRGRPRRATQATGQDTPLLTVPRGVRSCSESTCCAYRARTRLPRESVLRSSSLQAKTGLFAGTFRGPLFGSSRLEGLRIRVRRFDSCRGQHAVSVPRGLAQKSAWTLTGTSRPRSMRAQSLPPSPSTRSRVPSRA